MVLDEIKRFVCRKVLPCLFIHCSWMPGSWGLRGDQRVLLRIEMQPDGERQKSLTFLIHQMFRTTLRMWEINLKGLLAQIPRVWDE